MGSFADERRWWWCVLCMYTYNILYVIIIIFGNDQMVQCKYCSSWQVMLVVARALRQVYSIRGPNHVYMYSMQAWLEYAVCMYGRSYLRYVSCINWMHHLQGLITINPLVVYSHMCPLQLVMQNRNLKKLPNIIWIDMMSRNVKVYTKCYSLCSNSTHHPPRLKKTNDFILWGNKSVQFWNIHVSIICI